MAASTNKLVATICSTSNWSRKPNSNIRHNTCNGKSIKGGKSILNSTYRPFTIRDKAFQPFRDATGMTCFCGTRISKKNLAYYRDETGELKPICRQCADAIKEYIHVVFPVSQSKPRRYKLEKDSIRN